MNPYQPPIELEDQFHVPAVHARGASLLLSVAIFGVSVASALIVWRCVVEFGRVGLRQLVALPNSGLSSLLGMLALIFASWVSVALFGFVRTKVAADRSTYCGVMIVIVMVSIFVRAAVEPPTFWTPGWPNYMLTSTAVIALVMLRRQFLVGNSE